MFKRLLLGMKTVKAPSRAPHPGDVRVKLNTLCG